jgi:hypothetical protein
VISHPTRKSRVIGADLFQSTGRWNESIGLMIYEANHPWISKHPSPNLAHPFLAPYSTVIVTFTCERRAAVNFSCLVGRYRLRISMKVLSDPVSLPSCHSTRALLILTSSRIPSPQPCQGARHTLASSHLLVGTKKGKRREIKQHLIIVDP